MSAMKTCTVCGCTEAVGCPDGCAWTGAGPPQLDPICTRCTRIAAELGVIVQMAVNKGVDVGHLGYQALIYLVADPKGPRARLDRWYRAELPAPPPPVTDGQVRAAAAPLLREMVAEFMARGRTAQAEIDHILRPLPPAKRKPKRKAKR